MYTMVSFSVFVKLGKIRKFMIPFFLLNVGLSFLPSFAPHLVMLQIPVNVTLILISLTLFDLHLIKKLLKTFNTFYVCIHVTVFAVTSFATCALNFEKSDTYVYQLLDWIVSTFLFWFVYTMCSFIDAAVAAPTMKLLMLVFLLLNTARLFVAHWVFPGLYNKHPISVCIAEYCMDTNSISMNSLQTIFIFQVKSIIKAVLQPNRLNNITSPVDLVYIEPITSQLTRTRSHSAPVDLVQSKQKKTQTHTASDGMFVRTFTHIPITEHI